MRVLVVEDDSVISDAVAKALRSAGFAVDALDSGPAADRQLGGEVFDAVVLDLGLPGIDGFEVLRRLRARRSNTPVIILTARDALHDRVRGLDMGADDYLVKPFRIEELAARVRALVRRSQGGATEVVLGGLRFETATRTAFSGDRRLDLSARETTLLELLLRRAGRVVSKEALLQGTYDWDTAVAPNAIEVQVSRLRRKLAPVGLDIRTVRGLGYLLEPSTGAPEALSA